MESSTADTIDTDGVDFHHPFSPYDVQVEFMKTVYEVLQKGEGQIGILESPTGTGKSLSLICSALTWLRNLKRSRYESSLTATMKRLEGEPDWLVEQLLQRERKEIARKWQRHEDRLESIRVKEKMQEQRTTKRRKIGDGSQVVNMSAADEETEFLIGDWTEQAESTGASFEDETTRAILDKIALGSSGEQEEVNREEVEEEVKIYYTSRTHSQLTQFISELRRPTFSSSMPPGLSLAQDGRQTVKEPVKHIPLSSRQKLCINPSVARLGSLAAINDRCSELQQPKSKGRCPFLPTPENLREMHQFRDEALATLPDIEDMRGLGMAKGVCPYYASRTAIGGAEIVTLPYPLLLQESARAALGIKLEGSVVIIDEAHNIMDAIASVHASELRLSELRRARKMLGVYVKRFGKKLKGENRILVAQIAKVVDALSDWLDSAMNARVEHGIVDAHTLLRSRGADVINLYRLITYIQESKLAFKVESYASYAEGDDDASASQPTSSSPVLHVLTSFLAALTNLGIEGRIFFEQTREPNRPPDMKLSYLLLSPTHAFSSIAASARAIILAGGTMSPFDDYKAHLFPTLKPDKITTLSCGHVVPGSNLCVWTLASSKPAAGKSDKSGDAFEFSFQKRSDKLMIQKLGVAILNVCSVVPDGVVVFFPSYGYLEEVVGVWQQASSGTAQDGKSIWDKMQSKKEVFRDTKAESSEDVLLRYSQAILGTEKPPLGVPEPGTRGGLLLSVVGGKMSEGINFSDRLGRCVVVVGLPYPNINSPEWKARIEYIETATVSRLTSPSSDLPKPMAREEALTLARQTARDFYENACMRAVNQSIGRAIRHQNDYAAIVLVDRRFSTDRIRGKLPGWIGNGMVPNSEDKGLQGLMGALNVFFRGKKDVAQ